MILVRYTILLSLLMFGSHASALEFNQVQTSESSVTFFYKQIGVPLDGKFKKFSAQISFDPAKIAASRAQFDMDVASIDTGSAEGDDAVVGKLWFNAKAYPAASFVSTGLKALGGNRYEAIGKLSIKGKTLNVIAPATFQATGNRGVFEGTFTIQRLDYAIGEGEWTDLGTVANEIQIKFHIVVNATPGKK
jgi:polyisoprenoid-binding protein YceI